jgi:hypothetical protein
MMSDIRNYLERLEQETLALDCSQVDVHTLKLREATNEIDRLRAENAELRADEQRYRWLRYKAANGPHNWYVGPEPEPDGQGCDLENFCNYAVEGLDDAIDSAIEKEA